MTPEEYEVAFCKVLDGTLEFMENIASTMEAKLAKEPNLISREISEK